MRGGGVPPREGAWFGRPRWATWGPPMAGAPALAGWGVGLVPHRQPGRLGSPWPPIYMGVPMAFKTHTNFSLSLSLLGSRDSPVWSCAEDKFSPPYAHRRAAGLPVPVFRCFVLGLEPGVRRLHRTCVTPCEAPR